MIFSLPRLNLLLLVQLVFCSASLYAQEQLSVFNVDPSGAPTIRARFVALGAAGTINGLRPEDFRITEDGLDVPVTLVSCEDTKPLQPASIAISIDISGSMNKPQGGGALPITLATGLARDLVGALSMPPSDVALQTCDTWPVINHDFTTDRNAFLSALNTVQANGGNDFVPHLLESHAGLLNIAKTGRSKRVAILVTDAYWGALPPAELQRCIDTCLRHNIRFYAILCSPSDAGAGGIKESMRQLAYATGGRILDGVMTFDVVKSLVQELQGELQGIEPCRIEWKSRPACSAERTAIVELPAYGLLDTVIYTVPGFDPTARVQLSIIPSAIAFGSVVPGKYRDTVVTLTAKGGVVTVDNILCDNPVFAVQANGAPPAFTLQDGESRKVTIRCTPVDSALAFARIDVISDACISDVLHLSGGFSRSGASQLQLRSPNGGESFPAGLDTVITWHGVLPDEPVQLEYSTDAGNTWTVITTNATGLSYHWKVPNTPSNRCLARVIQTRRDQATHVLSTGGNITDVEWNADGREIMTVNALDTSNAALIWDGYTGEVVQKLGYVPKELCGAFSPDGKYVATAGLFGTIRIWSRTGTEPVKTLGGSHKSIHRICYTPDGAWIVGAGLSASPTVSGYDAVVVWDTETRNRIRQLVPTVKRGTTDMYALDLSPDGTTVVTGGVNATLARYDITNDYALEDWDAGDTINVARFSPDGTRIATGGPGGLKIWVPGNSTPLMVISTPAITDIDFLPDNKRVVISHGSVAELWDLFTQSRLRSFIGHTDVVNAVGVSPDGRRLVTGSADGTARIWDIEEGTLQADTSDALWSIVSSTAVSRDIDFGSVVVGEFRDSTVTAFVRNTGSVPLHVSKLRIIGPDGVDFSVVAGDAPFDIAPGDSAGIELRFKPLGSGSRSGAIDIATQDAMLHSSLTGTGIAPSLQLSTSLVDFGKVGVGDWKDTTMAFLLKNSGSSPVEITATPNLGPDRTQFSLVSGGGRFVLQPNDSREVTLRFAPGSVGRSSGGIAFDYTDGRVVAHLYGEGVTGLLPAIETAPVLDFKPSVCTIVADEQSVEIRNAGGATLTVSKATITGADASAFSFASTFSGLSIPPGESAELALVFTPTHTGDHGAALELEGNAVNGSPYTVALRGRQENVAVTTSLTAIDFGMLCPGESVDTTLLLRNSGTLRTGVVVELTGNVTANATAWSLATGESRSVTISVPPIMTEGDVSGTLVFTDTICGTVTTIPITAYVVSPVLTVSPLRVTGISGSAVDTVITCSNAGDRAIAITSLLPDDGRFIVDIAVLPVTIPPGETRSIGIRYQPSDDKPVITTLTVVGEPCNVTVTTPLEGRTSTVAAEATLALADVVGIPGELVEVPVVLRRGVNIYESSVSGFRGTLRFNATLLDPLAPTPAGTIQNGERVIDLDIPAQPLSDSTLQILRFRAMLGNDTVTALKLVETSSTGGTANVVTVPGRFILRGVCREGGARLLNVDGVVALRPVVPNPALDRIALDYEIIEEGWTELRITDALGEGVATPVAGELQPGHYLMTIDASTFPSGTYYCTLFTPTTVITRQIQIRR